MAFDPTGDYLASVDSVGTVLFWELSSGNILHTLRGVAPDCGSDMAVFSVLSWSPDGEYLAVPGLKGDVVMYDRDTAEKVFSLKGQHDKSVCYVSWSPNGKYIATCGVDRQVLIWDFDLREDIDRQKFDDRISCMAWKPNGNALAVIDSMGKYGVWESPVPSSMKSPVDGATALKPKSNGLLFEDEDGDQEQEEDSNLGNMSDDGIEASFGESEPVSRKRLRKRSEYGKMLDEDSDDQLLLKVEPRKKTPRGNKDRLDDVNEKVCVVKSEKTRMQEAFQTSSTPVQTGKRHFLCYNMLGSITTIENDGNSHIEVDFHDTGRGPRVPSMTDYFGFTMASLNERGSVFANPCKGEKNMSTLMYRPFSSWANNSEWSMRFEAEEVKVVALGAGWIAAATSRNYIRIFTEGGLQRYVLSLDGPVVTAAGFKDELAVVTHASDSLPSGDQMLEFKVFDISNETQPLRGRLPLTPGSRLSWFGFSEEGQLSSYDSEGVLRVYTHQFGGSWIPLFSASKEKKSDESYWMVGLNASKIFCIVCNSPDMYPQVTPKPVLTLLNLSLPLASSDLGADELESEFILNRLYLSQVQKNIEEFAASGLDTSSLDDEAFTLEPSLDRCLMKLIAACCNADKLVRATELASLLSMEKSVKGAIKLVTALKLPVLAERFSGILEERMANETKRLTAQNLTPAVVEQARSEPEPALPPPMFSTPQPSKQNADLNNKSNGKKIEGNLEQFQRSTSPSSMPLKNQHNGTTHNFSNKSVKESVTKEVSGTPQIHRPANPFAKTPSSEKASLFDSLKKKTGR